MNDDEEYEASADGPAIFRSKSGTVENMSKLDKISKKLRGLGFSGVGGVEQKESILRKLCERWVRSSGPAHFMPAALPAAASCSLFFLTPAASSRP